MQHGNVSYHLENAQRVVSFARYLMQIEVAEMSSKYWRLELHVGWYFAGSFLEIVQTCYCGGLLVMFWKRGLEQHSVSSALPNVMPWRQRHDKRVLHAPHNWPALLTHPWADQCCAKWRPSLMSVTWKLCVRKWGTNSRFWWAFLRQLIPRVFCCRHFACAKQGSWYTGRL